MAGIAVCIDLSLVERGLLQKILRSRSLGSNPQTRAQIVLAAADHLTNRQIQKDYGIEVHRVGTWRKRFHEVHELWKTLDSDLRPAMNEKLLLSWLADRPGRGRKATFTKEQKALITALACKPHSESGYGRHGTTCLFGNLNVATGEIVAPMLNATRTEEDFAENIANIVTTDPKAGWIFVCDNLNTHLSATLVMLVATLCDIPLESLGAKGKEGILKSQESRKAFLEDKKHRIRFVYTPRHCSWLNQIEIWFSGLSRRVLRRGNFDSVKSVEEKIREYITFYNTTARPMKWKYDGKKKTKNMKNI